jgi:hypothetical protein
MLQLFNFNPFGLGRKVTKTAMDIFQKKNKPLKFNQRIMSKLEMSVILSEEMDLHGSFKLLRDSNMTDRFVKQIMKKMELSGEKRMTMEETEMVLKEYEKIIKKYQGDRLYQKVVFPDGMVYLVVGKKVKLGEDVYENNFKPFLARLEELRGMKKEFRGKAGRKVYLEKMEELKDDFEELCEKRRFVVYKGVKGLEKKEKKKRKRKKKVLGYQKDTIAFGNKKVAEAKSIARVVRTDREISRTLKSMDNLFKKKRRRLNFLEKGSIDRKVNGMLKEHFQIDYEKSQPFKESQHLLFPPTKPKKPKRLRKRRLSDTTAFALNFGLATPQKESSLTPVLPPISHRKHNFKSRRGNTVQDIASLFKEPTSNMQIFEPSHFN